MTEPTPDRVCHQCGGAVVVGHHEVLGTKPGPDGTPVMDVRLRHYDCLPVHLHDADEFVAGARQAALGGTKDHALQAHLEGVMANGS